MTAFYLVIGLAGLWLASEITIRGALDISERFKISRTFVGLTILAVGTDVPELFVSIVAAINRLRGVETSGLVIGQVVGSSFSQIGLMLGMAGLFGVLVLTKRQIIRDGMTLIASAVLLVLLGFDGEFSRVDGGILLIFYLVYFLTLLRDEKVREKVSLIPSQKNTAQAFLSLGAGLVLLSFSAELTVTNALALSEQWGVAQSIIGALIVGFGTSIPEFATSAMAIRMGQKQLAIGNLIGSTTFDILVALGSAAAISGLTVTLDLVYLDFTMLGLMTLLVFSVLRSKLRLGKKEAMVLIAAYIIYVTVKLGETVNMPY